MAGAADVTSRTSYATQAVRAAGREFKSPRGLITENHINATQVKQKMRRKPDHKKLYIAIFIIAVMVLSTFGFILSFNVQDTDQLDYNNFKFRLVDNQWITKVDGKEYTFYFHPLDVSTQAPSEIKNIINTAPKIYLTFDPEISELQYVDLARFELSQFLTLDLGKNVENAVLNQTELYDLPIITCDNASIQNPVVQFEQLNQSKIFIEPDYCIRVSASTSVDFVKHAEGIIYILLGIIP